MLLCSVVGQVCFLGAELCWTSFAATALLFTRGSSQHTVLLRLRTRTRLARAPTQLGRSEPTPAHAPGRAREGALGGRTIEEVLAVRCRGVI